MGAWLKVSLPFLLLFFSSFSVSFFFLALLHFNVRQDRELQYFLQDLNSESQVVTPLVIIIYSGMKPKQQKVIEQTQPVLQGMGAWRFILSALKKNWKQKWRTYSKLSGCDFSFVTVPATMETEAIHLLRGVILKHCSSRQHWVSVSALSVSHNSWWNKEERDGEKKPSSQHLVD